eukprot:TRINITY_DN5030_c0_g1_i1.p1 TRINITY_DN5030_c0_g1~~TRINITY_DN5030_c0_g1_i1.p1  ORF type:complete len:318 (+),score=74.12 TRINITY_DN5030_c0_g1_i1:104-1057(+)
MYNPSWQQTMLRIKDPKLTLPFYQDNFGFQLLHYYHFEQWSFSLYFMIIPPAGVVLPEAGTPESEQFLWTTKHTVLELTHNYGTEDMEDFRHNNGNVEPHRGFGHIALFTDDVYESCTALEGNGVGFQKKPDEGRMKGLAFALDPDGYWIEIIKRGEGTGVTGYSLCQTMLRIKDPKVSLPFYTEILGLKLVRESHFEDAKFSLYFLAKEAEVEIDPTSEEAKAYVNTLWEPVLELTHNHGTEDDENFSYHSGNEDPRGFGHIGFLVDDLEAACKWYDEKGVQFKKRPEEGSMRGLAFIYDPDGYHIEIIQKGISFL